MFGFVLCEKPTKTQLANEYIGLISKQVKKVTNGFEVELHDNIYLDESDVKFSIIRNNILFIVDTLDILHYTFILKKNKNVKLVPSVTKLNVLAIVDSPCEVSDIIAASIFCKSTTLKYFSLL